jgi:non-ribosomal peptide synthetase component F
LRTKRYRSRWWWRQRRRRARCRTRRWWQVMLVFQNTPDAAAATDLAGRLGQRRLGRERGRRNLSCRWTLPRRAEGLTGSLSFASQLFDRGTVERLGAMFGQLLEAAVATPDALVADLALMSEADRHDVVANVQHHRKPTSRAIGPWWTCSQRRRRRSRTRWRWWMAMRLSRMGRWTRRRTGWRGISSTLAWAPRRWWGYA